jgi:hypothetical protein
LKRHPVTCHLSIPGGKTDLRKSRTTNYYSDRYHNA